MLTVQSNDFRNKEGSSESKKRKLFFMTLVVVVSSGSLVKLPIK